ncbi:MAG: sigma-54-dependent transcriptional regulator [Myxococcota bacterium]
MREGKILIVDDEEGVRSLLRDGMLSLGYSVNTAADGGAAISMLLHERFDAVVLDLQMAPIGGWEVLEHLRDGASDTAVLLLSAHVDVPTAVSAMRAGVFDVLEKPIRLGELGCRIDDALVARRAQPRDVSARPASAEHSIKANGRANLEAPTLSARRGVDRLLGVSTEIQRVREQIISLARFRDVPALIIGETGTGKEVVAAAIHDISAPTAPFVSINCAAIPEELFESELFGHEAGAFTGAKTARAGLLETVEDGTLFLDEVGEMPARLQPKFLRVLQTRTFRRIGGKRELPLRARVLSATNRRLSAEEQDGMRPDLYFRLAGFTIALPPLRKRISDTDILATSFLREFAERYPGLPTRLNDSAAELLQVYNWPGNIRELRSITERAAMLSGGSTVDREAVVAAFQQGQIELVAAAPEVPPSLESDDFRFGTDGSLSDLPARLSRQVPAQAGSNEAAESVGLNEIQRRITVDVFTRYEGNLARTARHLRIPRTTLRDRLRRYGVL